MYALKYTMAQLKLQLARLVSISSRRGYQRPYLGIECIQTRVVYRAAGSGISDPEPRYDEW